MKQGFLKKALPHIIAIVVFLVVAAIYCKPVLEGKVISQHDITNWKGAIHQSEVFKETHGHYPLWTNSLFSGMPAFQIGGIGGNYIGGYVHLLLTLNLPVPLQFFFLACICFYILCLVLRVNPYIAILGSLAFAYATYDPVIISVGHDTKMWSIAYMPALLGSVMLIYEKKYWLGAALTALFSSAMVAMNHLQITYYLFLAIGVMTIFFVVNWIKNKEYKHLLLAAAFTIGATVIGVLCNAISLFSTYEYQKETIRGGASELRDTSSTVAHSQTGLDKDYALSYSMNIAEPFVLMVPRIYGGSSDHEEVSQENSKAVEALRSLPQQLQQQLPFSFYWGGMTKPGEVGTSGPPYSGAIICFLAILAMFILDGKHKWWAGAAVVLAIMLSWGSYFEGFNELFYKYLPFYNKFRAPSMIMVIPQLLLAMLAVLCLNKIIATENKKELLVPYKKGLVATGAVFVVLFLLYFSFDFLSGSDKSILSQVQQMNQAQLTEAVRTFYDGMKADRQSLMMNDILRSLGFIAAAALLVFLLIRNTLKPLTATLIITALLLIDLLSIDTKYLSSDNYVDKVDNTAAFQRTKADDEILKDTSYYRVLNINGNRFSENITSYYYNSVGGYHPAKLRIYQDLIERYLSQQFPNENILDMLNTKYLIQKDNLGQTQAYQKRDSAYGPVWFVKNVRFVKDANEEMAVLGNLDTRDTAIMQEAFKPAVPFMPQPDSSATISLVKNDNDVITYRYAAASNQFAVFSEIYYAAGWKAFVDGKEMPIVKTDYVLRGIALPAGQHAVEFRFEPAGYLKGKEVETIFTVLTLALLGASIFIEWRKNKKQDSLQKA
ncbi:MAG TPA: YfhO family protein [Chitinophagaceae bacterium]|nr:YfhO family protein [Chitinophagaceae bacterium]